MKDGNNKNLETEGMFKASVAVIKKKANGVRHGPVFCLGESAMASDGET